jgi:O-antigen ligase
MFLSCAVAALVSGMMLTSGGLFLVVGLLLLSGVFLVGLLGETLALMLMTLGALVQLPVLDLGVPDVTLAEMIVPPLLFGLILRSLAGAASARSVVSSAGHSRAIHLGVLLFASVILGNLFRTKFFIPDPAPGVDRAYYGYFVGIGTYVLIYAHLVRRSGISTAVFDLVFYLSLIMAFVGVAAVILKLPLNLGTLRYSVYDYASGAVRVGFLEVFGAAGIALVCVQKRKFRFAAGGLFAVALITSGGRAAVVGVVIAVGTYLVLSRRSLPLLAMAATAAILVSVAPGIVTTGQAKRLTDINGRALEAGGRALIYEESFHSFAEQPLIGTGIGARFHFSIPGAPGPGELADFYEAQFVAGGHATYAALLKNLGLVGFVPFAAALIIGLWRLTPLLRSSQPAGFFFILLLSQAVSLIAGGNGSDPFYFFALAGAAAVLASTRGVREGRIKGKRSGSLASRAV